MMSIPGFFGSLFGELLLDKDCASIEQDPRADPTDKEICQQFRTFNEAFNHGFHIEHRPPKEDPLAQARDQKADPETLRDSILNRPKERREEPVSLWLHLWEALDLDRSVQRDPHLLDQFLKKEEPQLATPQTHSYSSVFVTTRPDGTYEERRTVKDSDGNEEVTVTYSDGEHTRTEVHKTTKDGTTASKTSDWLWSTQ